MYPEKTQSGDLKQGRAGWEEEGRNQSKIVISSSIRFSLSVVSDSLRPHEPQHARPLDDMCCVHVWVGDGLGREVEKVCFRPFLGHTRGCGLLLVSMAVVPACPVPRNWTLRFRLLPAPSLLSSLQPLSSFFQHHSELLS